MLCHNCIYFWADVLKQADLLNYRWVLTPVQTAVQAWQVPTPGMAGPNTLLQTWGGRTMLRGVILAVQSLLHTNISWNSCWELRIITRHSFHRWRCTRVGVGGVVSTFHCKLLLVIRREGIDYENKGNDPYDLGKNPPWLWFLLWIR